MIKHKVTRGNMVCYAGKWYYPDSDGFVFLPGTLTTVDVSPVDAPDKTGDAGKETRPRIAPVVDPDEEKGETK